MTPCSTTGRSRFIFRPKNLEKLKVVVGKNAESKLAILRIRSSGKIPKSEHIIVFLLFTNLIRLMTWFILLNAFLIHTPMWWT
jgi:hypothetical protein